MPLQNRVTPFSTIDVVPARGLFMGNRGRLHDAQRRLVTTRWRTRAWLICALDFRGRHRTVMAPQQYTELFFLDEAVALAAGHRPCAECRRPAFHAFVAAWAGAAKSIPRAGALDAALHEERVARFAGQPPPRIAVRELPFGAFFLRGGGDRTPWVVLDTVAAAWSHAGYTDALVLPEAQMVEVLTPGPTLHALRAGYRPLVHPSAGELQAHVLARRERQRVPRTG